MLPPRHPATEPQYVGHLDAISAGAHDVPEPESAPVSGTTTPMNARRTAERSAAFQAKWDVPNPGGDLTPDAELGTAYRTAVRMLCWNGRLVRYTQTLYPEAPGGLQVLTPPGAGRCFPWCPGTGRLRTSSSRSS
jgi:hypothetical protein